MEIKEEKETFVILNRVGFYNCEDGYEDVKYVLFAICNSMEGVVRLLDAYKDGYLDLYIAQPPIDYPVFEDIHRYIIDKPTL